MMTETGSMISLYGLESIIPKIGAGGEPVTCNGLTRPVKGLLAASLAVRLQRPLMVVCDKALRAEEFFETLKFFTPAGDIPPLYFPPWEMLPYEEMSPHPEISGQRLDTLIQLATGVDPFILVTTVEALARRLPPPDVLKNARVNIAVGDAVDPDILVDHLVSYGYRRVNLTEERGEFSLRGNIIDLFSGAGARPARIELFGDRVESIRLYNTETQRSVERVKTVDIIPYREVFYEGVDRAALIARFRSMCAGGDVSASNQERIEGLLDTGSNFSGMEAFTPLFFGDTRSLFDYLPASTACILDEPDDIDAHTEAFMKLIDEGYTNAVNKRAAVPSPGDLFLSADHLARGVRSKTIVRLGELAVTDSGDQIVISSRAAQRYRGDVAAFAGDVRNLIDDGYSILLVAAAAGGAERLDQLLKDNGLAARRLDGGGRAALVGHLCDPQPTLFEGNLFITLGKLTEGFVIPADRWAVITEDEILGKVRKVARRSTARGKTFGVGLTELRRGDLVAHRVHGIGRYVGAKEMVIENAMGEYLEIEYAERQRLYVPLSGIGFIRTYVGGGGSPPPLDRMGGSTWKKNRAKVKKSLLAMADKLLQIYAARELVEGTSFSPDTAFHQEFADTFEFEETEDQLAAIVDVAADMEKSRPMDRLVCGDVGYGKTEIAMRAAFKTVYDGKQVAVLVPTTLLAQQHYQTFSQRFKAFPITVEVLSRFKSRKEQKAIVERTATGEVNILIGTHRLLQKDIRFNDLGLAIIDEEQRFGVRHKEKLKTMRQSVDALTLTATPIPRTLHTSLLGIRDLSVIETPPPDRQSIRTSIVKFSDTVIREAALRELDRGGQVFFVHNKVKSIHRLADYLRRLTPEARVDVAHGKMPERDLEQVMVDFVDRKIDILVCTTIIESGLDIPSANTIMINRADHFGLAQLYQLRGRVGRARHRAYGYLLIPGLSGLTETARQRLKAIEELSELGSGFRLAARDMEIRGGGNLLGAQQSGHIDAVGFEMYSEMLEDTIRELKGEPSTERFEVDMNLTFQGRIAPGYVPDLNQRIDLYNRLAGLSDPAQLADVEEELADRFGPPPEETRKLLAATRVRTLAKCLRVEKVDITRNRLYLVFSPATQLDPQRLATASRYHDGGGFRFVSDTTIEFIIEGETWRKKADSLVGFLEFLVERL